MRILRLVLLEIGYRKLNFTIAWLTIAVAVGYAVCSLLMIDAYQQRTAQRVAALDDEIRKITVGMGFNINVLPSQQNLSDFHAQDFGEKTMPEEFVHRLAQSPLIKSVRHLRPALIRKLAWPEYARQVVLIGVTGVVPLTHVSNPKEPLAEAVAVGTMHVGAVLAEQLGLQLNKQVTLQGHPLTVTKIYPARGSKDDITIWIDLRLAQEILALPGRINLIQALECNCASIDRLAEIRQEISSVLGTDVQVIELATTAIARAESRETVRKEGLATLARMQNRAVMQVFLLTAAGCLLIGLLALMNVAERRAEIGILRAIGTPTKSILLLFLSRACLLGILGVALGFAGGALLAQGLESRAADTTAFAGFSAPYLRQLAVRLTLLTPLLTMLASWLPAWFAAGQDPALVLGRD